MNNFFNYKRRSTNGVHIGNVVIGGEAPIVVQTMTNTNTLDTQKSLEQCIRTADAGAKLIRLTAQGVREAENLRDIHCQLRERGYSVPLSADIHFNPKAAAEAAKHVEKVRINPGNFSDKVKKDDSFEYSNEEYEIEKEKLRLKFVAFLNICKENNRAIRIGVNHGSLSDRLMSRYGDTPEGMVESCMEYLRICIEEDFLNVVISMKASNTLLMTKAVRLLVDVMKKEGFSFPLHLGVTEAGNGEDGRIKSAVGIGALLSDGIGDTIRVSLSEEPEEEIPVAKKLVDYISLRAGHPEIVAQACSSYSALSTDRRKTSSVGDIGGENKPVVISDRSNGTLKLDSTFIPDYIYLGKQIVPKSYMRGGKFIVDFQNYKGEKDTFPMCTPADLLEAKSISDSTIFLKLSLSQLTEELIRNIDGLDNIVILVTTEHLNGVGEQRAVFHKLMNSELNIPVVIHRAYCEDEAEDLQIKSGVDFGTLILDGFGDGIMMSNCGAISEIEVDKCMFGILQAARVRTSKTEFISCPGCGRTLFNLQNTVDKVKESFSHLSHLKIAVMGCIVNGPGEMADADYGYVGATTGKISLYKKKECIEKNIPQDEAVQKLIDIIKDCGDWIEPKACEKKVLIDPTKLFIAKNS